MDDMFARNIDPSDDGQAALLECVLAQTEAEAEACFARLTASLAEVNSAWTAEERASQAREVLGYWFGYETNSERARLEALYHCAHPVFGSVAECGFPTAEQAFEAGLALSRASTPEERERIIADVQAELRRQHALETETAHVD